MTTKQHEKQRQKAAEQTRHTQQEHVSQEQSPAAFFDRTSPVGSSSSPETATNSPETYSPASSPGTPVTATRLRILDLYPTDWHPYLRPIMVRNLAAPPLSIFCSMNSHSRSVSHFPSIIRNISLLCSLLSLIFRHLPYPSKIFCLTHPQIETYKERRIITVITW